MFSDKLKKKVAALLVWVMMLTNISPAFTMGRDPDYKISVSRVSDSSKTKDSFLQIDIFRHNKSAAKDYRVATWKMLTVPNVLQRGFREERKIGSFLPSRTESIFSKIFSFTQRLSKTVGDPEHQRRITFRDFDIKFRLDESDSLILESLELHLDRVVELISDCNVVINSLKCEGMQITAPHVAIQGAAFINSLGISLSGSDGIIAIDAKAALTVQEAFIKGRLFNYGTINLSDKSKLIMHDMPLFNSGVISGNGVFLENVSFLSNEGVIAGKNIDLHTNLLINKNRIGDDNSALKMTVYKTISNVGDIISNNLRVIFTASDQSFINSGFITSSIAELDIAGKLQNNGRILFDGISGNINYFSNLQEFLANSGVLKVDRGENKHILRLENLMIRDEFSNTFTDGNSVMQLNSLSGDGKFYNRSAFTMVGENTSIDIHEFINSNQEFCEKYGVLSFGKKIKFWKIFQN